MNRKTEKNPTDVKNSKKKNSLTSNQIYSIIPFVLLLVSILLESCLIFPSSTGAVGQAVRNFMCGVFGAVSYLIPAGLLMFGFFFFDIRRNRATVTKTVTFALFVIFFAVGNSVISDTSLSTATNISVYFNNGVVGVGGGAVGGLLGRLMVLAFDRAFSVVICVLICVVSLSLFIGAKRIGLWHTLFEKAKTKIPTKKAKTASADKKEPPKAPDQNKPTPLPQNTEPTVIKTTVSEPEYPKNTDSKYDPFAYGSELDPELPTITNTGKGSNTAVNNNEPQVPDTLPVPTNKHQVPRTNENPMTANPSVPTDSKGNPRAYSPFANPFHQEEPANNQPSVNKNNQNGNTDGNAYSPFADPFKSINDEKPSDRNIPPQAYIACDTNYDIGLITQTQNTNTNEFPSQQTDTPPTHQQNNPQYHDVPAKKNGILKFLRRPDEISSHNGQVQDIYSEETPIKEEPPVINNNPYQNNNKQGNFYKNEEPKKTEPSVINPDYYSPPFDINDEDDEYEDEEIEEDIIDEPTPHSTDGDIRQVYGSEPRYPNYAYPTFDLLDPPKPANQISEEEVMEIRNTLLEKLSSFRIEASLSGYSVGPTITRYEITPGPGVKVRQITALTDDLALALQSDGVRIATVSGKSVIGVEVPNEKVSTVSLRALIESREFINAKSRITVCVGLTVTGKPVYMDIDDMPHVLIAGETKSGKSVAINCMILSLLYRASPDEVQLILIDPKRVELNIYSKIPHLVMPVIDDPKRAAAALRWAVNEMDRRYMLLDKMGVRNREEYCELRKKDPTLECMPQIIIVIDELADLMLQVREYVEELINRLAAMARACGMHLLVGTQRPSVDIITGLIKANIPARIAFKVSSAQDSRIILGGIGAEKLLGRGDMLYQATGAGRMRIQGAFVSGTEIKRLTSYLIEKNGPAEFDPEILRSLDAEMDRMNKSSKKSTYTDDDDNGGVVDGYEPDFDLLCRAIEYILETGKTSTNVIQRVLHVGFNRAADIIDALEDMGFLSHKEGNRPRDVQVTWEMYEEWKMRKQL